MNHISGLNRLVLLLGTLTACSAESALDPLNIPDERNGTPIGDETPIVRADVPIVCNSGSACGMLAFVSDRSGNPEIYTARVDGTDVKRLTDDPALDIEPAWSPDGQRIAFVSNRLGRPNVFAMNADGSNVVQLSRDESEYGAGSPTWSPDGKRIAFSNSSGFTVVDVGTGMPVATSIGFPIGYQVSPSWSPDGRIAFVSDWHAFDFMYDVFVMNPDGSNIRPLLIGHPAVAGSRPDIGTYFFEPAWSRDGGRIAAVVCAWAWDNCYPESRVAIANADGSDLRIVARPGGFSHPTWSPDGSMIAFSSQVCRGCASSIRYVRTDMSGVGGPIVDDGYSPSWRPY